MGLNYRTNDFNDDIVFISQEEAYGKIAAYMFYVREDKILDKYNQDTNQRQVTFYQEGNLNQFTGVVNVEKIDEIFYYICTSQTYNQY